MDTNFSIWSEFGLAGMVIGSLFTGVYFLLRWILNFVTKMSEQHLNERADWQGFTEEQKREHREERREWLEEFKSISLSNKEGLERVCDTLSGQITNLALRDIGRGKQERDQL